MGNLDGVASKVLLAVVGVALATTIFGRKTSASVIDALGGAFGGSISAALGKGVQL